jgi:hypothetical protein
LNKQESGLSYLKPQELLETSLRYEEQTFIVSECPANIFDTWISEVVGRIKNVDRQKWELFEKWRIINKCLEHGVLQVTTGEDDTRLLGYVPVVESAEKEVEQATA